MGKQINAVMGVMRFSIQSLDHSRVPHVILVTSVLLVKQINAVMGVQQVRLLRINVEEVVAAEGEVAADLVLKFVISQFWSVLAQKVVMIA